jgi:multidrug efflux pump subunit AcrA (membrane-fusion protein)
MLNITHTSVKKYIDQSKFKSFKHLEKRTHTRYLPKILIGMFIIFIAAMFLPWTQNIRSTGEVSTLNPYDRPQNIQSLIGGRIEQWYVKEGDIVSIGDTIVKLTEAKAEYLDPNLLSNTKQQQEAKLRSVDAYAAKQNFLSEQLVALEELQNTKLQQLDIKQQQLDIEITSVNQELVAAQTYSENASNQLNRMQQMYEKGIKSLTDLESKRLSNREAEAKLLSVQNKITKLKNDKLNIIQEIDFVSSDYEQKVAKIESEIQSTNSYRYSLEGESNKLQSKFNEIEQRQNAYIITSPIEGRITKILKNGIGEFVKTQEKIATIVPLKYQRSVELYVKPVDMPLVKEGKEVRLQFDGWPAIIFSGWPDNSFGTYSGEVYAIDNDISENGSYRIIVVENDQEKMWPELIRIGSGARGLLLLNDVRVYYELWRKLNGFPPDFYEPSKTKKVKNKAPIRKVK